MAPTGHMHNTAPGHGGVDRDPSTVASHAEFGPRVDRLRRSIKIDAEAKRRDSGVQVDVAIRLQAVGHSLPTGYIDRHLILVVEGTDGHGSPVPPLEGPLLPSLAGSLANKPGRLYAKQAQDFDGHSPAPFWGARPDVLDTRLEPDRVERQRFDFPRGTVQLRVRLIHRPFWEVVVRAKKWPDNQITVIDRLLDIE